MKFSPKAIASLRAAIGAFIVILSLGLITDNIGINLMIASFGSTCAIVFALPDSPAARARNIMFSYITSAVIAYLLYQTFGYHVAIMALGVAVSIFLMMYENLIHPPAAGIPIFFYYIKPEPEFLLFPILTGCVAIIIARKIFKKLHKTKQKSTHKM